VIQGEASPRPWRPFWNRWVDRRQIVIWIWPVSALVVAGGDLVLGWSLVAIWKEDFANVSRKVAMLALNGSLFLAVTYGCVGFYQMFFIELRQKFIASKVIYRDGDGYQLWGYYFKRDMFKPSEVISVGEHRVKIGFGKNIATLLTWQTHNYKVTLKDGREFYLPGEMERLDELRTQFEADIQTAENWGQAENGRQQLS